jgi:hypothetical protein
MLKKDGRAFSTLNNSTGRKSVLRADSTLSARVASTLDAIHTFHPTRAGFPHTAGSSFALRTTHTVLGWHPLPGAFGA